MELSDRDYRRLLELRLGLRRFLKWSEEQATAAGISPAHHQLMLAIRGHGDKNGPAIKDVAGSLLLRHHSAVELVDRAADAGLIRRVVDRNDQRVVRLVLTKRGTRALEHLATRHLQELDRFVPRIAGLWKGIARQT